MKVGEIVRAMVISSSEDERGQYDLITVNTRVGKDKFQKMYYTNNIYSSICRDCGTWNYTSNHECIKDYIDGNQLIDELDELLDDDSTRIYINGRLI